MGRSKSSCFKIITCARGDSDVEDPVAVASPESKVSSDKRGWSFRKISSGLQFPTSSVISEPLCVSYNKENSDITANTFHSPKSSSVSEKTPHIDTLTEIPPISSILNKSELIALSASDKYSDVVDHNIHESVVVVIQASIRGYLVRNELHKVKNVIKLQAVVRGHLVRREAVGTLRCVQAIIKLQALIRARHTHMLSKKLDEREGKRNPCMKSDKKYNSSKSLLSNGFARQLLESTPKRKVIYIDCNPSKSDSSWKWLERWMAKILSEGQPEGKLFQGHQGQEENSKPLDCQAGNDAKLAELSVSSDSNLVRCESIMPIEDRMHLVTKSSGVFEFHDSMSSPEKSFNSLVKEDKDQSRLKNWTIVTELKKDVEVKTQVKKYVSPLSQMTLPTDTSELIHDSISDKPGSDSNLAQDSMKALSESLDTERQEFVCGSKPCSPVLSTAQSKFEDLFSTSTVCRIIDFMQDAIVDSSLDNAHCHVDSSKKMDDRTLAENSFSHDPRFPVAASECGTEISISSTLDSPDRSEADGGEIILELGSLENQNYHANGGSPVSFNAGNTEAKSPFVQEEVLQPDSLEECDRNLASSMTSFDAVQVNQSEEYTALDMQSPAENSNNQQINRASLEGTPQSHTTAAKLHGTPSSQNSASAKKSKKESKRLDRKLISQISKKSPSNSTKDSGGKSSGELLQKDFKNAKRRNSLETDRPDHVDQEPTSISTSNSLPSYMQATESARAKAHASISPKSSPDLHYKDNHMKKRPSLPIANGKQGSSPRMHRSTSQTHQSPKGNGIHSPLNSADRKWQR